MSGSAQPLCTKGDDIVCSAAKAVAGLNIRYQSNDLMRTQKGHIGTKISINPYAPRKVQLPGLGDDENISGKLACCHSGQ